MLGNLHVDWITPIKKTKLISSLGYPNTWPKCGPQRGRSPYIYICVYTHGRFPKYAFPNFGPCRNQPFSERKNTRKECADQVESIQCSVFLSIFLEPLSWFLKKKYFHSERFPIITLLAQEWVCSKRSFDDFSSLLAFTPTSCFGVASTHRRLPPPPLSIAGGGEDYPSKNTTPQEVEVKPT